MLRATDEAAVAHARRRRRAERTHVNHQRERPPSGRNSAHGVTALPRGAVPLTPERANASARAEEAAARATEAKAKLEAFDLEQRRLLAAEPPARRPGR